MIDLINRQQVIDAIHYEYDDCCNIDESGSAIADDIERIIDNVPSVQSERKKGTWTDDTSCPFCGFQPWYERDIHTLSFCPHCGADLRGERDE